MLGVPLLPAGHCRGHAPIARANPTFGVRSSRPRNRSSPLGHTPPNLRSAARIHGYPRPGTVRTRMLCVALPILERSFSRVRRRGNFRGGGNFRVRKIERSQMGPGDWTQFLSCFLSQNGNGFLRRTVSGSRKRIPFLAVKGPDAAKPKILTPSVFSWEGKF